MASFTEVWKDCGFDMLSEPRFMVVPFQGINLAYLNGVQSPKLDYDRNKLDVREVGVGDIQRILIDYSSNFGPARDVRASVHALGGEMRSVLQSSRLLAITGKVRGETHLDVKDKRGSAKLDIVVLARKFVSLDFRFVRFFDLSGNSAGSQWTPADASKMVDDLNAVFMPQANIEFELETARITSLLDRFERTLSVDVFRRYVLPFRDGEADFTIFFAGKRDGPVCGSAFRTDGVAFLDDAPKHLEVWNIPWPRPWILPDQLTDIMAGKSDTRPYHADRDLQITLAHEVAHLLGGTHNNRQAVLMSVLRQSLKLDKLGTLGVRGGVNGWDA